MFKAVKDFKRRSVQTILKTTGSTTEGIVDEDYDTHVKNFHHMIEEMHECGDALHGYLSHQKTMFSGGQKLSLSIAKVYNTNTTIEQNNEWPGVTNDLDHEPEATVMQAKWDKIHETYRSSTAAVCQEYALEPIKAAYTRLAPEIDNACKVRNAHHVDYESYTRRIKVLKAKQEDLIEKGKAEKEGEKTQAFLHSQEEIEKIQNKLNSSQEHYEHHNTKSKADIVAARHSHDEIMDTLLVTTLVCQYELFAQATAHLKEVVKTLPQDKVDEVRLRIADLVNQGGVKAEPKKDKGLSFFGGKKSHSETKTEDEHDTDKPEPPLTNSWDEAHAGSSSCDGIDSLGGKSKSHFINISNTRTTESNDSSDSLPSLPAAPEYPPYPVEASGANNPFNPPSSDPSGSLHLADGPASSTIDSAVSEGSVGSAPAAEPTSATSAARPASPQGAPPVEAIVASSSNDGADSAESSMMVEALYDHVADDDDELNFSMGDMVEVLETPEGGWWKGRCHGSEGLFPVNYVKTPLGALGGG